MSELEQWQICAAKLYERVKDIRLTDRCAADENAMEHFENLAIESACPSVIDRTSQEGSDRV